MREINYLEIIKRVANYKEKWDFKYVDIIQKDNHGEWLKYYLDSYIGNGEVSVKVKDGAILIERVD